MDSFIQHRRVILVARLTVHPNRLHVGWTTDYLDAFAWDLTAKCFASLEVERYVTGRYPPHFSVPAVIHA